MKIRVGSRESKLAVIQSRILMETIHQYHPEIELELVTMKTTGDKILDRTLDKVGGKGLFVKELDRALLEGQVDLTVHSFKDMPMDPDPRLPIVAVSEREDPRDALVLPAGCIQLGEGPIGCSSFRRRLQLAKLFPGREIKPIRGNVLTRLEKLDRGKYAALVLACAGLNRLGLENRINCAFTEEEILPAACQGILAVQAREDMDTWFLREFHDPETKKISDAERSFVRTLDGGCSSPVAANAFIEDQVLYLTGLYAKEDGSCMRIKSISGSPDMGAELGRKLALELKEGKD
jgi:hydroxymethylbilane synthase